MAQAQGAPEQAGARTGFGPGGGPAAGQGATSGAEGGAPQAGTFGAFGFGGKMVWKLGPGGKLIPVPVHTGLTDGSFTEVSGQLREGDMIVVGLNGTGKSNSEQRGQNNPFMPQMRGPGRR
jgi:HlyD family secretion protein